MVAAVKLEGGQSGDWFRRQARILKDANQVRRCLSLSAVADGMNRGDAAKVGGMDRQTLRDWVHRFNEFGIEGLKNHTGGGPPRKLTPSQEQSILDLLANDPIPQVHGCVRWRIVDLCAYAYDQWKIEIKTSAMRTVLQRNGMRLLTARPVHVGQDLQAIEIFKKTPFPRRWQQFESA